jgi:PTH1 family peptidyl-tRNA hydrolase
MKLIVGLGNPGRLYIDSRHNIGFSVVKALAKDWKVALKKDKGTSSLSAKVKFANENLILALPLTFMNLSGTAVKALLKKYKVDLNNLFVICDDLDLEFGRIKVRPCGSSGGHRGLKSIIESLKTQSFCRLRIGIGRPLNKDRGCAEFVLTPFSKKEKAEVKDILETAKSCVLSWITKGITETMNVFNKRSKNE